MCRDKGRDVQIHHIDGDDTNNTVENLVVVCLDCHSRVTGPRGLGRSFSPEEVKKYKVNWESMVKKRRNAIIAPHPSIGRLEKELLRFEAKRQVYELSATSDVERAKEILEFLDNLNVLEFDKTSYVLDQFKSIAPFMQNSKISSLVAEYVPHYFWHLPGPEDMKIGKHDIANMRNAVDLVIWMAKLESWTSGNPLSMQSFVKSLSELFETAESYGLLDIEKEIIQGVKSVKQETSEFHPDALPVLQIADETLTAKLKKP